MTKRNGFLFSLAAILVISLAGCADAVKPAEVITDIIEKPCTNGQELRGAVWRSGVDVDEALVECEKSGFDLTQLTEVYKLYEKLYELRKMDKGASCFPDSTETEGKICVIPVKRGANQVKVDCGGGEMINLGLPSIWDTAHAKTGYQFCPGKEAK